MDLLQFLSVYDRARLGYLNRQPKILSATLKTGHFIDGGVPVTHQQIVLPLAAILCTYFPSPRSKSGSSPVIHLHWLFLRPDRDIAPPVLSAFSEQQQVILAYLLGPNILRVVECIVHSASTLFQISAPAQGTLVWLLLYLLHRLLMVLKGPTYTHHYFLMWYSSVSFLVSQRIDGSILILLHQLYPIPILTSHLGANKQLIIPSLLPLEGVQKIVVVVQLFCLYFLVYSLDPDLLEQLIHLGVQALIDSPQVLANSVRPQEVPVGSVSRPAGWRLSEHVPAIADLIGYLYQLRVCTCLGSLLNLDGLALPF